MKFENSYFWKHNNCLDVFFCVSYVVQDENGKAILRGNWMIQGIEHFWAASNEERLFIKKDQYHNWKAYEPTGDLI